MFIKKKNAGYWERRRLSPRAAKTVIVKFMVPGAIFAVSSWSPGRCANPQFIFHTKLGANE
jgi:hypothetical protein